MFWKHKFFGWLGFSPTSGSDSDSNVSSKELAIAADVIQHMRIWKYTF